MPTTESVKIVYIACLDAFRSHRTGRWLQDEAEQSLEPDLVKGVLHSLTPASTVFKGDFKGSFSAGGYQPINVEGNSIVTPLSGGIDSFDDGEYIYVRLDDHSLAGNHESAHIIIGKDGQYIGFIS